MLYTFSGVAARNPFRVVPGVMTTPTASTFRIQRAAERGVFDHGWLKTAHSFSFAGYSDPVNQHWGALRVFNDDVVLPGEGFGKHPHRDMEILTYVLSGELEHEDSIGNSGVVRAGGVQYLSAGTGIAHSEYNHSRELPVHFVQMWVLPQASGLEPRYGQVDYSLAERHNRWLPIASGESGVAARIALWQDASAYVARLDGAALDFAFRPGRRGFLFVASGELQVNGETLGAGDAVRLGGPLGLNVRGGGEAVLWDVPPIGEDGNAR
jgi:redox-sensitive bicupin YhaK (pirin superfamily)